MLLIHGENTYIAKRRLDELIYAFTESNGSNGLIILDGSDCAVENIFQEIGAISMFVPKKLLVIKYFSENKDNKKFVEAVTDAKLILPDEVELLFWENSSMDKRTSFYKMIKKYGDIEEFKNESGSRLVSWVRSEFVKRGKKISKDVARFLILRTGEEYWRLASEIEKLSLYCEAENVLQEDIEQSVPISATMEVWGMLDAIGARDRKKALGIFERLLQQGEDSHHLISLITWQFRQLIQYKYESLQGKSSSQIAASLKINPYVAKKMSSGISRVDLSKLKVLYDKLVDIDFARKTSTMDPRFAITLLLSVL